MTSNLRQGKKFGTQVELQLFMDASLLGWGAMLNHTPILRWFLEWGSPHLWEQGSSLLKVGSIDLIDPRWRGLLLLESCLLALPSEQDIFGSAS